MTTLATLLYFIAYRPDGLFALYCIHSLWVVWWLDYDCCVDGVIAFYIVIPDDVVVVGGRRWPAMAL
jgi:hypothetical protein